MTPLQVQFSCALCNVIADWSKMKTCQTSLLKIKCCGISRVFFGISGELRGVIFQPFARKTEME